MQATKWPRSGAISMACASIPVTVTALDDHDLVAMVPAAMPPIITVRAEFSAGAIAMMIAVMTILDYGRLGVRHRRCNECERAEGRNDITKLLHDVLLQGEC